MENKEIIPLHEHKQQPDNKQGITPAVALGGCLGRTKAVSLRELLPLELWSTEGKHSGFCPGLPSVLFDVKHLFFFLLALRPDLAVKCTAILTALLPPSPC